MLVEDQKLDAVISMPGGVFKPYAGVSTAILLFTKTNSGGTETVWFYDMKADGLSLDDKRDDLVPPEKQGPVPREELSEDEHEKNNLPDILSRWSEREGNEKDNERTAQSFCVPKSDIEEQAYDLSINRYKEIVYEEIEHRAPNEIIADLESIEAEIHQGMKEAAGDAEVIADVSPLKSILSDAEVFNDGDWVESKDQDQDGDVRLIQLADIGDGEYLDKSNRFMTSSKAKALRCTYLKPGDSLLARMPDPLGRCCIFPGDEKPCVTVVDVCIVRPNTAELNTRWLMHCLNAPQSRHQIQAFSTGTTRKRISRSNLGKIGLSVPPLEEQKRIAEVLDRAEALRARRRAALALLDELTQSIFLDMFGDPTVNHHEYPDRQLSELIREEDRLNYGVVQPGDHVDDGVPLVRVGDLQGGRVSHSELKRVSPSVEDSYKRSRLKGDEILD